jgi:hypothetical protein
VIDQMPLKSGLLLSIDLFLYYLRLSAIEALIINTN